MPCKYRPVMVSHSFQAGQDSVHPHDVCVPLKWTSQPIYFFRSSGSEQVEYCQDGLSLAAACLLLAVEILGSKSGGCQKYGFQGLLSNKAPAVTPAPSSLENGSCGPLSHSAPKHSAHAQGSKRRPPPVLPKHLQLPFAEAPWNNIYVQ